MKTVPPPCPEPETGLKYWRSLDHLADTPEFKAWAEREFPEGASELTDPVTRRSFMQLMSASFLLAGVGLTGCRRPVELIQPFSKMPEGYVHGVPQYYATAMPSRGSAVPLLVKSNDGRPTKVEPNPAVPGGSLGTDLHAQASVLSLYDPDRATRFTRGGNSITREAAWDELAQINRRFAGNGGLGLAFLVERSSSPSRARLQAEIAQKFPASKWYVHEPVDLEASAQAHVSAFGQRVKPVYQLAEARTILSLDCDFTASEENAIGNLKGLAASRRIEKPGDPMSRLYMVEGLMTVTGGVADHRLRVPTGSVVKVGARVALEVVRLLGGAVPAALSAELQRLAQGAPVPDQWAVECARDLVAQRNRSVVLAGYRQPTAVHLIAAGLNSALGAVGTTVRYHAAPAPNEADIVELSGALNSGAVNTLVILGGNPVYNAPADLNWAQTQRRAATVVRLGYYEDETFAVSDLHLPLAHYLESWGDARLADGTAVPVQPLIAPLYGGVTELEVLARIAGSSATSPHDITRQTFASFTGGTLSENLWRKFLHDGFIGGSARPVVSVQLNAPVLARELSAFQPPPAPGPQALEVVLHRDYKLDDGRGNNNGWLQELPDPISKLVWDNAVLVSRKTAADLGLKNRDVVRIEAGGRSIEGPVWIQPGHADNTLGIALGYGRSRSGRIGGFGGQSVGFNAYPLRSSTAPYIVAGAKVTKTGRQYLLAVTQEHGTLDGRPIIREANWQQFQERPDFARHMDLEAHAPNAGPIYKHPYDEFPNGKGGSSELRTDRRQIIKSDVHQWGMAIDLNGCVGCGACVIACQSENNIPIVGKDQVYKNREMAWLRIDRYFSSHRDNPEEGADEPQVNMQPMLCQHCESAPCESVCPVNATVHDEEGLNVMAYNRCVGTRYCSNNCPWKVRRFNFFDYNKRPLTALYKGPLAARPKDEIDLVKMAKNPDVTVRMRGVMEKCTFCVQRIETAKINQKIKVGASGDVRVPEGTFTTACAQACPADAIAFGNLLDENSRVSKLKHLSRSYATLGFLDTKPRVTYLARIRNPNPAMPDYHQMPLSLQEYEERRHDNPFAAHGAPTAGGPAAAGATKGAH